jgi:hypothetical protein
MESVIVLSGSACGAVPDFPEAALDLIVSRHMLHRPSFPCSVEMTVCRDLVAIQMHQLRDAKCIPIFGAASGEARCEGWELRTTARDGDETNSVSKSLFHKGHKMRASMKEDSWNGTLSDGRSVKYGYKELSDGVAALSAKVERRLMMIVQKGVRAPMTREQVEWFFEQKLLAGECDGESVARGREGEGSVSA